MDAPNISKPTLDLVKSIMNPMKAYFNPVIIGLEKIEAERPALYVCNHTIFGLTDGFFLGAESLEQKGVLIHPLVADTHLQIPIWKDLVTELGMVRASRENCAEMMKKDEHIMVFPGGVREVCKHKGEAYHLVWKNHVGFVHMAIEYGYDLVPVASYGGEETYEILWDADDIMQSNVGWFLKKTGLADKYFKGGDAIPPIVKGLAGTSLPKPERIFIKVGDRIDTKQYAHHEDDEEVLFKVRHEVEEALEEMFQELHEMSDNTDDEWWRKLLKGL